MNPDKLLEELARVHESNPKRLQVVVETMSDIEFERTYGHVPFARINMVVPESVVKLFGGNDGQP